MARAMLFYRKVVASGGGKPRETVQRDFWHSVLDAQNVEYSYQRLLMEEPADNRFLLSLFDSLSRIHVALCAVEYKTPGDQVTRNRLLESVSAPIVKEFVEKLARIEDEIRSDSLKRRGSEDKRKYRKPQKDSLSLKPLVHSASVREQVREWFAREGAETSTVNGFLRSIGRTLIWLSRHKRDMRKNISDVHRVVKDLDVFFEVLYHTHDDTRRPAYMKLKATTPWLAYIKAQNGLEHELQNVVHACTARKFIESAQCAVREQIEAMREPHQYQKVLPAFSELTIRVAQARKYLVESTLNLCLLADAADIALERVQECIDKELLPEALQYLQCAALLIQETDDNARDKADYIKNVVLERIDFNCFRRTSDIRELAERILKFVEEIPVDCGAIFRTAQVFQRYDWARSPEMILAHEAAYGIISRSRNLSRENIDSVAHFAHFIRSRCIDAHRLLEFRRKMREQLIHPAERDGVFRRIFDIFCKERGIKPLSADYYRYHALFYMAFYIPAQVTGTSTGKKEKPELKPAVDLYEIIAAEQFAFLTAENAKSSKAVKTVLRELGYRHRFCEITRDEMMKIIHSLSAHYTLSEGDENTLIAMLP